MIKNKKILILSLSTGSGHTRAAEAIKKTILQQYPHINVEHIDMLHYLSNPFKRATVDAYDLLIKTSPELWGILYKHSNNATFLNITNKYSKKIKNFNTKKLHKYLQEYQPNYIISTHFFCTDIYLSGKEKHSCNAPISTVITDYRLHELWLVDNTDHYFVPTEQIKTQMIERGIDKQTITVSGIPIDPVFYQNIPPQKKQTDTNILVMSGGQGLGQVEKIVKSLTKTLSFPYTITAITGKNKKLQKKLKKQNNPNITVIGWTNNIEQYMRRADIIISKPGGLTTTECITLGKPLIAINPIPGQEEANAQYIEKHGYGLVAKSITDLPQLIQQAKKLQITTKKIQK